MITCVVVDDHPVIRLGLRALLSIQPDMSVVGEAGTGEEAVEVCSVHQPRVVLMDLRLPSMKGVEAIRRLLLASPQSRCIVLTTYDGDEDIHQALAAGARGYLIKGMSNELLLDAVRLVNEGKPFIPPPIARTLRSRKEHTQLSAREREVLSLLAAGRSNREIAAELRIAEATVKVHVSVILNRLDVHDRTQAVVVAVQRGLVHL